jgi:hypothetical protein
LRLVGVRYPGSFAGLNKGQQYILQIMIGLRTKELSSLAHGKTDEVVLALGSVARRAASVVEHLEGLHGGG